MIANHCTCRVTREHFEKTPYERLVILTNRESSPQVKGLLAVTFSQSHELKGEVWDHANLGSVMSLRFEDPIPEDLGRFTLQVCTDGRAFTKAEIEGYERWKKAAAKSTRSGRSG